MPVTGERELVNVLFVRQYLLVDVPEPLHNRLAIEDAIQEGLLVPGCVLHLVDKHHGEPAMHERRAEGDKPGG